MQIKIAARLACQLVLVFVAAGAAYAQADKAFPQKPIRVIAPFPPGSAGDIVPRTIGLSLAEEFKQNIVIDNRPGAGGNIAAETVKNGAPDGYTLMLVTVGTHAINKSLYSKLPYDPVTDFAPVVMVGSSPNILVVTPSLPANSVKELVALAKAKPGGLNFSSSGSGTSVHLSGEMLNVLADVKTVHVPYRGAAEAMTDLMAGRVQFMFATASSGLPFVRSGKVRALAVTSPQRHSSLPDVPAMNETVPGFEVTGWYGFVAPARTPAGIVNKLNAGFVKVLKTKELRERMLAQGIDTLTSTPEEFGAHIRGEVVKWEKVVKASGAKVD